MTESIGETCDDGNTNDGDGCSSKCTKEPNCGVSWATQKGMTGTAVLDVAKRKASTPPSFWNRISGIASSRKYYASGSTATQRKMFWVINSGDNLPGSAWLTNGPSERRLAVHRDNNGEPVLILDLSQVACVSASSDWESISLGNAKERL